jgi:hypothetical protein
MGTQPRFWAWAFSPKDNLDDQLKQAVATYTQKYRRAPFLVFVGQDVKPLPLDGLQIEQSKLIGKHVFYFALYNGKVARGGCL